MSRNKDIKLLHEWGIKEGWCAFGIKENNND